MQVSHQEDRVTHAVLTANQTIDFGISNSAEFFNILSSTLYKDQILAVVREGLCNAWDAHIEAGCQHKPVEITLSEDKFIIKDFGLGIPRDKIGAIYGTYGASTKTNDGKQTGGFGLGCKSPFAYTDHFEVISCAEGVKTIYTMSKSSAQVGGKPGISPIASFPTIETGLQVSINIKREDRQKFYNHIKTIAANGDMNMLCNGKALEKLGFDTSKSNYLITRQYFGVTSSWICVRYGNVIYPVEHSEDLQELHNAIVSHLEKLKGNTGYDYRIIFQAPPHSIAVQPSREGLSMQEHTISTLRKLFTGFLDMLNGGFQKACANRAEELMRTGIDKASSKELLKWSNRLPASQSAFWPEIITDMEAMARRYISVYYPENNVEFRKKDMAGRVNALVQKGLLDRGLAHTYLREVQSIKGVYREPTDWLKRRIIAPLMAKLQAAKLPMNLFIVDPNDDSIDNYRQNRVGYVPMGWASKASPKHIFHCIPYLRNIVVLAQAKTNLLQRCYNMPEFKNLGEFPGFLFYHTGTKKADKEAALKFFQAQGMRVVDLTFKQPWEIEDDEEEKKPVVKKVKKVGLPALSNIMNGGDIQVSKFIRDDAVMVANPKYVICLSTSEKNQQQDRISHWRPNESKMIVEMFGAETGVTNKSDVAERWVNNGAQYLNVAVVQKIIDTMKNSAAIHAYWPFHFERLNSYGGDGALLAMIYRSPVLRKYFKLTDNMTKEERYCVAMWDGNHYHFRHGADHDEVIKLNNFLDKLPYDPQNDVVKEYVKKAPLTNAISTHMLQTYFDSDRPEIADNALRILKAVLNLKD